MKKFFVVLGSVIALLLVAALVLPFVVDVDQYRPKIVEIANTKLNGKLELGKLKLSLWGQILVRVDGVRLFDSANTKILSVDDAYFHVPLLSIFSGAPLLTFKMQKPEIKVIKDRTGKLNVMSLVKSSPSDASTSNGGTAAGGTGAPQTADSSSGVKLPAIALRARLGVELSHAFVQYEDQMTGLNNQLRDLNVSLRDISLSRPTEIEIWADLDTRMGKSLNVRGPFKISGKVEPDFSGGQFQKAAVAFKVNADDLKISMPGTFEKGDDVDAHIDLAATVTQQDVQIKNLNLKFHNAEVKASGGLKKTETASIVDLKISSNEIELAPWVNLLPMAKGYELGGSFSLSAEASGPSDKLNYNANIAIKDWTAKAPNLKAKPVLNGKIHITTDKIEDLLITFTAPGNQMKISGQLVSFSKPNLNLSVTSDGMDLDQLIEFPKPEAQASGGGASKASAPSEAGGKNTSSDQASSKAAAEDLDAKVGELRNNPMMAQAAALINIKMASVKAYNIALTNIVGKLTMKDLKAAVETFKLNMWSGGIDFKMGVDLKPKQPTYTLSTKIEGLDLKQAVTSQLALFKNTVYGKLFFNMAGNGASFNSEAAKRRLNVKGDMKVLGATFTSIDVGKMTTESINGSLDKLAEKYPQLKGKKIKGLPNQESKYERVSTNFTIADGTFNAPNFEGRAYPQQGVDLEGTTRVGLIDQTIQARWKIIDRYNLTGAKDIGVNIGGTDVNGILASGNPPAVSFPVTISGTLDNPKYSYSEVAEYLAKVALENTVGAAKGRAQAELKKHAGDVIDKVKEKAPPQVDKLFKKLGF